MRLSTIPMTCSLVLATLAGAGLSHWWSLGEIRVALANPPLQVPSRAAPAIAPVPQPVAIPEAKTLAVQPAPAPAALPSAAQKEFYESLLDEMKQLKKTNLALRDQMAETNRDLMKLEFRVDTQSESFRPLPVTENLSTLDTSSLDTSTQGPAAFDADPSVLPPRAVTVGQPN